MIAEVGHNHQGSVEKAMQLFEAAKDSGAHASRFSQKRSNRELYTREYYTRPYDHENSYGLTYGEHREFLEFERGEYQELQSYAEEIGITFFATPFDPLSVEFCEDLGMPAYKVASADLKSLPLLRLIAETGKPMILLTALRRWPTSGAAMRRSPRSIPTSRCCSAPRSIRRTGRSSTCG